MKQVVSKENVAPLKCLHIYFQTVDEFVQEMDDYLFGKSDKLINGRDKLTFDSPSNFWTLFTPNRLAIVIAISKMSPNSVYQLAKILDREPHHVLADCRLMQTMGMVKLKETKSPRKSLKPVLSFSYEMIWVHSELDELLPIGAMACDYLKASLK